jgi:hypothetical protein
MMATTKSRVDSYVVIKSVRFFAIFQTHPSTLKTKLAAIGSFDRSLVIVSYAPTIMTYTYIRPAFL